MLPEFLERPVNVIERLGAMPSVVMLGVVQGLFDPLEMLASSADLRVAFLLSGNLTRRIGSRRRGRLLCQSSSRAQARPRPVPVN